MVQAQPISSDDALQIAQQQLLAPAGLDLGSLDRTLATLMSKPLDYGDLYFQLTRYEAWTVEDGIVKEGSYSVDQGMGVRANVAEKTGFAYADQLDEASLIDAVEAARGIARTSGQGRLKVASPKFSPALYPAVDRDVVDFDAAFDEEFLDVAV